MELWEARAMASNIIPVKKSVDYTINDFLTFFPAFSKVVKEEGKPDKIEPIAPIEVMEEYLKMAKDAIQQGRWGSKWKMAMGLYIAHYLTLYLKTYQPADEDNDVDTASASGTTFGNVSSATEGDQSINYDNNALTEGTRLWGMWNATTYGQQLITEAKLLGLGGAVIG